VLVSFESEANSYLARYFTGEAASSQSDEAVRVLRIHANTRNSSYLCVIPSGSCCSRIALSILEGRSAPPIFVSSRPESAERRDPGVHLFATYHRHLPRPEHAQTIRTDPSVLHITE
jgi:hypothetical protein